MQHSRRMVIMFLLLGIVKAWSTHMTFQFKRFLSKVGKTTKIVFSSVQFSHSVMSNSLRSHGLQHARPPCPSPTPRVHPNPWPLSWWCHPTILSSVVPFSSCLQSFPASGSFQMDLGMNAVILVRTSEGRGSMVESSHHQGNLEEQQSWRVPSNLGCRSGRGQLKEIWLGLPWRSSG